MNNADKNYIFSIVYQELIYADKQEEIQANEENRLKKNCKNPCEALFSKQGGNKNSPT